MARFGKPHLQKIRPKGVYNPASFNVNRKLGNKLKLGFKKPTSLGAGIGKLKL